MLNDSLYIVKSPYFSLKEMCEFVSAKVDESVANAVRFQDDGTYNLSLEKVRSDRGNTIWSDELFMEMLSERDEIAHIDFNYDDSDNNIFVTLADEYIQRDDKPYHEITENEMELILAKHILWKNHQGGERADLSDCLLKNCDLSRKKLEGAIFDRSKFSNVNLNYTTFDHSSFKETVFLNCDGFMMSAEESDFTDARLAWCSFNHANMSCSRYKGALFENCNLYNADMSNSYLADADFKDMDMRNVNTFNCDVDDEDEDESEGFDLTM